MVRAEKALRLGQEGDVMADACSNSPTLRTHCRVGGFASAVVEQAKPAVAVDRYQTVLIALDESAAWTTEVQRERGRLAGGETGHEACGACGRATAADPGASSSVRAAAGPRVS